MVECPRTGNPCMVKALERQIHDKNNVIQAIQGELELIYLERGDNGALEELYERLGGYHGSTKKDLHNDKL